MGRTIIQPIGPLYGEAVNGTVFGRPNGSIYVPSSNTVTLTAPSDEIKNNLINGNYRVRFSTGGFWISCQSQDTASNLRVVLASDNDLSTVLATQNLGAGLFNTSLLNIVNNYQLTVGNTYYVGCLLLNNGETVAVSNILEVEAIS